MNINGKGLIQLVTSSTATVDVTVSYHEEGNNRQRLPGDQITAIATATTTTILGGPTSGFLVRAVDTIAIRNKHASTAVDVTVQLVGVDPTSATGALITGEVIKATLAVGSHLLYDEGKGWTLQTAGSLTSSAVGSQVTLLTAADVVNANATPDTLADVTGLTFPVVSGQTYWFRACIPFTSAATTTGSRWTVNGPTMTAISFASRWTLTATTEFFSYFTALLGGAVQATALTTGNIAVIEGQFKPSADGTFAIQFSSEVTVSAITALKGAKLDYMRVA